MMTRTRITGFRLGVYVFKDAEIRVEAAVAPGARLERFDGLERFDILPLLVCTDGAVSRFGRDVRRLRPNILIGGVDDNAERYWEGPEVAPCGSRGG